VMFNTLGYINMKIIKTRNDSCSKQRSSPKTSNTIPSFISNLQEVLSLHVDIRFQGKVSDVQHIGLY